MPRGLSRGNLPNQAFDFEKVDDVFKIVKMIAKTLPTFQYSFCDAFILAQSFHIGSNFSGIFKILVQGLVDDFLSTNAVAVSSRDVSSRFVECLTH